MGTDYKLVVLNVVCIELVLDQVGDNNMDSIVHYSSDNNLYKQQPSK
jgi:hypothetical protein